MADALLDGKLAERITDLRGQGLPWEQIARRLAEHGVQVSAAGVRNWGIALGIGEEAVA